MDQRKDSEPSEKVALAAQVISKEFFRAIL